MISNGAEWVTGGYPYLLLFPLGCLVATVLALVGVGRRPARRSTRRLRWRTRG